MQAAIRCSLTTRSSGCYTLQPITTRCSGCCTLQPNSMLFRLLYVHSRITTLHAVLAAARCSPTACCAGYCALQPNNLLSREQYGAALLNYCCFTLQPYCTTAAVWCSPTTCCTGCCTLQPSAGCCMLQPNSMLFRLLYVAA